LRAEYEHGPFQVGAGLIAASSQYAHGDENNGDVNGKVPGYAVVNLDARYEVTRQLAIFALVSNLFDKQYYNFAVLGENFFTGPDRSFGPALGIDAVPEQFRAIGAPRGIWIGLRYSFDAPTPRS
jgi:outer membrane receptor protein involved in Fe transport